MFAKHDVLNRYVWLLSRLLCVTLIVQGLLTELAAELRERGTDRTRCGGCVCPNQATGPRACFSATWL